MSLPRRGIAGAARRALLATATASSLTVVAGVASPLPPASSHLATPRWAAADPYPPFSMAAEHGPADGLGVGLLPASAGTAGRGMAWRTDPWEEVKRPWQRGEIEPLRWRGRTSERESTFGFAVAGMTLHEEAVVRQKPPCSRGRVALAGRRVAVRGGDNDHDEAFRQLARGRHEMAVLSHLSLHRAGATQGLAHLAALERPLRSFDAGHAAFDGQRGLHAAFAEGRKTLAQNGDLHPLPQRWLGVEPGAPLPPRVALRCVMMAVAPLVLLLLASLALSRLLQRRVARRTAELAKSEAQARALFEASPDAVLVIDPEGRIINANSVAVERYGCSREELLAMPAASLNPESARQEMLRRLDQARQQPLRFDSLHRTCDGREVPVEVSTRPLTLDGQPCILASARDVSDRVDADRRAAQALAETQRLLGAAENSRRFLLSILEDRELAEKRRSQLEEQLRQAQKMEAIGTLAGGVAHDFNNLLQATLSQLHRARLHVDDQKTLGEILSGLEEQVRRGAALTRQLLLFSRREAATYAVLDLGAVVYDSAQFLRRLIRENVQLHVSCLPDPLPIQADRGQLEQALVNLVVNASQAMPEGGALTIGTERFDADTAVLFVSDTGCGIPPEIVSRIFEPFFTTKAAEHGTGLGLAVVHGIASRHGGRVEVESEVGKGSTFRLLLPLQAASPADGPAPPPDQSDAEILPGNGERILVVEDEQGAREGLKEILLFLGYEVVAVGSGAEAFRQPLQPAFRLLLTDLMLPDVRGSDLARTLCERWPSMKVILMSGYAADDDLRRLVVAGEVRFLQKPVNISTLAREIGTAMADG